MAGYTKLFGSIVHSTIWHSSKDVKILWITMLALAEADGMVEASIPGLAAASGLTLDECEAAIVVLESPDKYSKNPEHEGRRIERVMGGWKILNYIAYRNKMTVAQRRDANAERVRRHREKRATSEPAIVVHAVEPTEDHAETICPTDLHQRAEKIFPEMLEHMPGITMEQIRDGAREIVGYYTIGRGAGEKRRHWMKIMRESLRRKFETKRFKAPGEIEHNERKKGKTWAERRKELGHDAE